MAKKRQDEKQSEDINRKIAEIFFEMADLYELKKDRWKPQAYRLAAQTLQSEKEVQEIYAEKGKKGIERLSGIGSGIAKKIIQYINKEKIKEYEKLKKSVPKGLNEIMSIPGVGPKTASKFYNKLNIKSLKQLKKAAKENKLQKLPNFKKKAEQRVLQGIEILESRKGRIKYNKARKLADKIIKELEKIKQVEESVAAGSLRRKMKTVGDLDIVVKTEKPKKAAKRIVKKDFVKKVLGKGKEKVTVVTDGIQVDIRFFNKDNFGSGLLYFTGDKQHNIWLRKKAIKKGYKLSEYGLFKGKKRIAGKTEKEIYNKLNIKMPNPEKRVGKTK